MCSWSRIGAVAGVLGGGYLLVSRRNQELFPPEAIPYMPPLPGYKIVGYMGSPASKVEDVREKRRLLFFAEGSEGPKVAQYYALIRTSLLSRIKGEDEPVVLQLEVPEAVVIQKGELWKDRRLGLPPHPTVTQHLHMWPAFTPKTQIEKGMQMRLHHVVSWKNNHHSAFAANIRALRHYLLQSQRTARTGKL